MSIEYMGYGIEEPHILAIALPLMLLIYLYVKRPGLDNRRWIYIISRSFYVSLLVIALASPYILSVTEEFRDVSKVSIFIDRSASMELYGGEGGISVDREIYDGLRSAIERSTGLEKVELKEFSTDNATLIGDTLYQESVEDNSEASYIVLVSDGNNNYGRDPPGVAKALAETGSVIYPVILEEKRDEIYISGINGGKKTPANSKYAFTIDVAKIGGEAAYDLRVYADERMVSSSEVRQTEDMKEFSYTVSFETQGPHILTAYIIPQTTDLFEVNNRYTKTVDVVDKPAVLLVSRDKNSPLSTIIGENYDLTLKSSLPDAIDEYTTVIIDNINSSRISDESVEALNEYLIDGNGLVIVGGDNAFDRGGYKDRPRLEAILPVTSMEEPEKKRKEMAVAIVIDISASSGYGMHPDNSKISVEKGIALNLVEQLDPKDYVGVIAFNVEAFTITDMARLEKNRAEIEDKIPRLMFGGGTDMLPALNAAEEMLKDYSLDKYVIVISDGVLGVRSDFKKSYTTEKVSSMRKRGITVYTVGVGFDTDQSFMSSLAAEGNGIYFHPDSLERLKFEFEDREIEKSSQRFDIGIYDRYHFITESIELPDTAIGNYNDVTPKSISRVLVSTEENKPVVTVWRFGLGRVACISTDNGREWAREMYEVQGGKIISAITNWAIGDLEKMKEVRLEAFDTNIGENAEIYVRSDQKPTLTISGKGQTAVDIPLRQVDIDMYMGSYNPLSEGFYNLEAKSAAGNDSDGMGVNQPVEYFVLGTNGKVLKDIAQYTDGKAFEESQTRDLIEEIVNNVREVSLRDVRTKTPLRLYVILATLSLFLLDIVIRRVNEIRRLKRTR